MIGECFSPNWISPPGETIQDIMHEKNIPLHEFAKRLNMSPDQGENLLKGLVPINKQIADCLENIFGTPAQFWENRESIYRKDEKRLFPDGLSMDAWIARLPTKEMLRLGWIKFTDSFSEKTKECLSFFGVKSLAEWNEKYQFILNSYAFRTTPSSAAKFESMIAWLRQGEIIANKLNCMNWNPSLFSIELQEIRKMTRKKDPNKFIPELQERCSKAGVALVIIPSLPGCGLSGATKFLAPEKCMLLLSYKYLTDDHFWFSFFHEAGHLLMHSENGTFLEYDKFASSEKEIEANAFAENILIPDVYRDKMMKLVPDEKKIIKFAMEIGVSPGIIVGQLQHHQKIGCNKMNHLKKRYKWNEANLEMV